MNDNVIRLYPPPAEEQSLEGLYLAQDLRLRRERGPPFVYSNFIASLDGHISEAGDGHGRRVPKAIANPRDWRLYMELAAQADVLLTTERQLKAIAEGREGNFSLRRYADLCAWRKEHELSEQPATVIISPLLQISVETVLTCYSGAILILASGDAPAKQADALKSAGIEVVFAGTGPRLTGAAIVETLNAAGYTFIYSIAGPQVLHTLLQADVLDRLYLTLAQVALGGDQYDTLTRGPAFNPPPRFKLHELYLDPHPPGAAGQFFISLSRGSARDEP